MASVPHPPASAELPLFRFGLRQLFAFVAVVCALLTELVASQGVTGLALVVVTLVIIAHVTATALGTRLRDAGASREQGAASSERHSENSPAPCSMLQAPRSVWYGYDNSSLARLPTLVLAGTALGGIGGTIALAVTIGHRTSLLGLAVGAVSISVLGGWFAFLGSSFCAMFRHGWREAVSEQRKDEVKRTAE